MSQYQYETQARLYREDRMREADAWRRSRMVDRPTRHARLGAALVRLGHLLQGSAGALSAPTTRDAAVVPHVASVAR